MERKTDYILDTTSFHMAELMRHRLPLCLGATAGFCLILSYAWQQVFTTCKMISWRLLSVGVLIIGWFLSITNWLGLVVGLNPKNTVIDKQNGDH
ncbi:MAG: hypothetical protein ACI89Z_000597 [Porticoccus sp.]|jgi:hypothetical protein